MRKKLLEVMTAALVLHSVSSPAGPRSSGAGNAGDTLERYLAATRQSLILTLLRMRGGQGPTVCECPGSPAGDPFCLHLKGLSDEQRQFCRDFLFEALDPMLRLSTVEPITPLVPVQGPLMVGSYTATALTMKGPAGNIRFDHEKLRALAPMAALAILTHEMGHKVPFGANGRYLDDDEPIGPFTSGDGGRRLLDALGSAVAVFAAREGLVGRYAGVWDRYLCSITDEESGAHFSAPGNSRRLFLGPTQKKYETGIGLRPGDLSCAMREPGGTSQVQLRIRISESHDCSAEGKERQTLVQLWRTYPGPAGTTTKASEKLQEVKHAGLNPVCVKPKEAVMSLTGDVGGRRYRFEAWYDGTDIRGLSLYR